MSPRMIKTMTDQELENLDPHAGRSSHATVARAFGAGGAIPEKKIVQSIPWKLISTQHPDYDAPYWQECRALYSGGKKLLRDKDLMERLFPSHNAEDPTIYAERVKRAHYFPYPGALIDAIASGLGADPVVVLPSDPDDKDATIGDWWQEFFSDVTKPGADRMTLANLAVTQVKEAMITEGISWMLVDMPQAPAEDDPDAPKDRLEQEKRGLLDPYVTPIPAENVIEWTETEGELDWIVICDTDNRRNTIFDARGDLTKTFTIWTRSEWMRYSITFDPTRPPKPDDEVALVANGAHPFGKVPVVRIELSEGLRAMDKIESMAREHFNKRNALSWAEYKSLFALLYEFLGAEEGTSTTPVGSAQEDPDRALSVRGQGYVNERGGDDRAEFVGPPTAPFKEARESCAEIKREMYRVMHSMADSAEMNQASARRSGESKAQDGRGKDVLLRELGRYAREAIHALMELLQVVKGDEPHRVGGADNFDSVDLMSKVTEAVELLNGVPMKSPTFLRIYLERIYTLVLKGEVTDTEREAIRAEIAQLVTIEDLAMMEGALAGGGDPDEDEENGPPPPRPAKKDEDEDEKPKSIPMTGKLDYKSKSKR